MKARLLEAELILLWPSAKCLQRVKSQEEKDNKGRSEKQQMEFDKPETLTLITERLGGIKVSKCFKLWRNENKNNLIPT